MTDALPETPPPETPPSDDIWSVARDLFEAGQSGQSVCADLGLAPSSFWRRAHVENWLRRDRRVVAPEPLDLDAELQSVDLTADKAWRRMCQALDAGRAGEALSWRRLHADLTERDARRAAAEAREEERELTALNRELREMERDLDREQRANAPPKPARRSWEY